MYQPLTRLEIASVTVATGRRDGIEFRIGSSGSSRTFGAALSPASAGRDLALEFVSGTLLLLLLLFVAAEIVVGVLGSVERNGCRAAVMAARVEMSQLVGRLPQTPLLHHDIDEQACKTRKEKSGHSL